MKLPRVGDDELDAGVAALNERAQAPIPTRCVIDDHTPDPATGPAEPAEFLALQPRLDGTGGRFHGELGPVRFAQLAEATAPGPADEPARAGFGAPTDPETVRRMARTAGRRRLEKLFDLLDRTRTPGALLTKLTAGG